jgi:GT2 family glycosyltransferase
MITVIYSTHKDENYNQNFRTKLSEISGVKDIQILEYVNHNQYSLAEIYNRGIKEAKYDIVVCCHNDIKLERGWGIKLIQDFQNNPEFGIIGKAGSCFFPESGVYWEKMNQTMVGQVYHHPKNSKKWLNRYSVKTDKPIPVVTVDGLFISFDKNKIKHYFDETIGKFHFYDHGFCIPNYLDGVVIGVTSSFEITHESVGKPNQEFFESKDKFLKKWGSILPLDLKPKEIIYKKIPRKIFQNFGKVAVIIPTKGNVKILKECITSFFEHCNINVFDIFIADTGSSEDEKNELKDFIGNFENINFIEFDYYNFAKINNEVVKKHINNDYEFLLFCNNDIKLINDVITGFLDTFQKNKKTGTVGARLHYGDNTIQHNGVFMAFINQKLEVGHLSLKNYYNFFTGNVVVFGNTGGLLMIRKKLFEKVGFFNENYISCFEDVELNIETNFLGFENIQNGDCVAYHYESLSRNLDPDNLKKLNHDYINSLIPAVNKRWEKIKNKITIIK